MIYLLIFSLLYNSCTSLYEDQAFKFDWKLSFLGVTQSGYLTSKSLVVGTKSSDIIASIHLSSGQIHWRHQVYSLIDIKLENKGKVLLSLSGSFSKNTPYILRSWSVETGVLFEEKLIAIAPNRNYEAFLSHDIFLLQREKNSFLFKIYESQSGLFKSEFEGTLENVQVAKCSHTVSVFLCTLHNSLYYISQLSKGRIPFTKLELPDIGVIIEVQKTFQEDTLRVVSSHNTLFLHFKNGVFVNFEQHSGILDSCKVSSDKLIVNSWCDSQNTIVQFKDGSLQSLYAGWTRHDGLADISAVSLVPISKSRTQELGESNGVFDQFSRRIKRHVISFLQFLYSFSELTETNFYSGIHKMIVVSTGSGALYGIDSNSGQIVWFKYFEDLDYKDNIVSLFLQQHESLAPISFCVSSKVILTFNPLTGDLLKAPRKLLNKNLTQAFLLHNSQSEIGLQSLFLLFDDESYIVEPPLTNISLNSFIVTYKKGQEFIYGKRINEQLPITWSFKIGSSNTLIKILGKSLDDHVHSQGRVMADRSVLFKYINPNLGVILTENSEDSIHLHLLDFVTGRVLFSLSHKRVSRPFALLHSENWIIYSYYNDKARRTEIGSLELFEGYEQSNASVFSSFSHLIVTSPFVERQSYIFGGSRILALQDTKTSQSITSKHILILTDEGRVYHVPRSLLDPRRPNNNNVPLEMREGGLLPYIPDLSLSPESILNYNRTLLGPRGIVTAPTDWESTSIVFVYGLDLFCTRIAPSKGFDLLNEDFDYYIISSVLVGLVIAALVTRKLSHVKNIKYSWK